MERRLVLVRLEGIEPPTHGLEGRRSIQLSYRRALEYSPLARRVSTFRDVTCPRSGSLGSSLDALVTPGTPRRR